MSSGESKKWFESRCPCWVYEKHRPLRNTYYNIGNAAAAAAADDKEDSGDDIDGDEDYYEDNDDDNGDDGGEENDGNDGNTESRLSIEDKVVTTRWPQTTITMLELVTSQPDQRPKPELIMIVANFE